jgi:hypothetical protein
MTSMITLLDTNRMLPISTKIAANPMRYVSMSAAA